MAIGRRGQDGQRRRGAGNRWLAGLLILVAAVAGLAVLPLERPRLAARSGPAIADARAWGYQLQRARSDAVAPAVDLMIIDYSADGTEAHALKPRDVEAYRQRPGASPRIVLAYMSIGEAESYRYYWSKLWSHARPSWLGAENQAWRRNYLVQFWQRGWQRLIVAPRPTALRRLAELPFPTLTPYIDRIIDAGFDGVMLDRVDAYEHWQGERSSARDDMIGFVQRISAYAKARRPGFLVVAQNAEELLTSTDYTRALDAVVKEDLLYGIAGDGQRNDADDVTASLDLLLPVRKAGLPVLVVEYLADAEQQFEALERLRQLPLLPLFATRRLNQPPKLPEAPVQAVTPVPAAVEPAAR